MPLTINGISFESLPSGMTPGQLAAGRYYATGDWSGPAPWMGAPVLNQEAKTITGVDGTGFVGGEFRSRPIGVVVLFAGTLSGANGLRDTALEAFAEFDRYPITLPNGATVPDCKLVDNASQTWLTLNGKCVVRVPCLFAQYSLGSSGS